MSLLLDRVRLAREGAAVERCHTRSHLLRYSVGHHTFDAVTLLLFCWAEAHEGQLPRAELIVAMIAHDLPELITGDTPSPVKDLFGEKVAAVDRRVESYLGLDVDLTDEERLYLEAADRFELWLWCIEEKKRGNSSFEDWVESYYAKWQVSPLPWPFMDLVDEVLSSDGLRRLEWAQLKEIAGL